MKLIPIAFVIALLTVSAGSAFADETSAANPQFDTWSKCAVGSDAVYKQTTDTGGHKIVMDVTKTLAEKADDHVTLENKTKTTIDGKAGPEQDQKETVSAKGDEPKGQKKLPNETVELAGHKFDCTVNEVDAKDAQGNTVTVKMWTSSEVPGGLVKMEGTSTGFTIKLELQSFDKK